MHRLITILGHTRAGKDTVADIIGDVTGSRKVAFADAPKGLCSDLFGIPLEAFYDARKDQPLHDFPCKQCPRCKSLQVSPAPRWMRFFGVEDDLCCKSCKFRSSSWHFRSNWTPRMMTQHLATEGCRFIDPRIWAKRGVRAAFFAAARVNSDVAVISDGRFITEAEETVAAGGEVWRLRSVREEARNGIGSHRSQLEVDRVPLRLITHELRNDGSIKDLRATVLRLLAK